MPPVRRQARGLKRMAEILDAAEQVIAETGYPDLTTNQVAARAGMSPGSLYQFFRNKEEILDGLVARYTDERRAFWAERMAQAPPGLPLERLIDALVDESVAFKTRSPAYWSLLYGTATGDRLAAASLTLHAAVAEQVRLMLAARAPGADPARLATVSTMAVAMVKAVMPLLAEPGAPARELVAELKTALVRYLEPVLKGPVTSKV
ncbi:MAG: TetR family transcriptional regulator [Thermoactinospora sp.]|nr:TetR family transcriptional regulator [Thermoactinospora sp.]